MHDDNEDDFEYLAFEVVITWLEKCCHLNETEQVWNVALMFPEIVPSAGRSKLHDIANYFNLAHHTTGRRGSKNRRTLVYPKTMFLEKQEQERQRLIKERNKIREKFLKPDSQFLREPPVRPTTFREQVLRELWEEKNGKQSSNSYVTTNMIGGLSEESVGKLPEVSQLRDLIVAKRKDLVQLNEQMTRKMEAAQKKLEVLKDEERQLKELEKGTKEV